MSVVVPIEDLHRAVYERLATDLQVSVYDEIPDGAEAPYVVLVGQQHKDMSTKTSMGWDATFEVNIWSQYRGTREVAGLLNMVVESMNREWYTITGFRVLPMGFAAVEVSKASRGGVPGMLGVVRQRLKITPTA